MARRSYTVRRRDNLLTIAKGNTKYAKAIYKANPGIAKRVGAGLSALSPGMTLNLPTNYSGSTARYTGAGTAPPRDEPVVVYTGSGRGGPSKTDYTPPPGGYKKKKVSFGKKKKKGKGGGGVSTAQYTGAGTAQPAPKAPTIVPGTRGGYVPAPRAAGPGPTAVARARGGMRPSALRYNVPLVRYTGAQSGQGRYTSTGSRRRVEEFGPSRDLRGAPGREPRRPMDLAEREARVLAGLDAPYAPAPNVRAPTTPTVRYTGAQPSTQSAQGNFPLPTVESLPLLQPDYENIPYVVGPNGERVPYSDILEYYLDNGILPLIISKGDMMRYQELYPETDWNFLVNESGLYTVDEFGDYVRNQFVDFEEEYTSTYSGYTPTYYGGGGRGGGGGGFTYPGQEPRREIPWAREMGTVSWRI